LAEEASHCIGWELQGGLGGVGRRAAADAGGAAAGVGREALCCTQRDLRAWIQAKKYVESYRMQKPVEK
jgi:hypothetical protein